MAAGFVVRVWALGSHSLLLDEASVAIGARDMLRNHTALWDADSNAPFVWLIAHLLGLRGLDSPFLLRLPAAVFGTASILFVYWLARRLFDERIAGVTALLFAIHPFAVAFNRVLFADTFQLFFILLGCIAFDYFAASTAHDPQNLTPLKRKAVHSIGVKLLLIFLLWGAAFLMKYNAVVPGALWLAAGVVARRYSVRRAFLCFVLMSLGSFATLVPWPYDAPVWLFAFLNKSGSYNAMEAAHFFWTKLHLILFGITEIALTAGVIMSIVLRGERRKSIAHMMLFVVFDLVTISILGRSFERYMVMIVPFACLLIVALAASLVQRREHVDDRSSGSWVIAHPPRPRIAGKIAVGIAFGIFAWGLFHSYSNYLAYLHNDYDHARLTKDVLGIEAQGTRMSDHPRAFWLLPEPVGGYYLGFSQFYSRAIHPSLDGPAAEQNFFEWASVPYGRDLNGYGILAIRRLAQRWGIARILRSPLLFKDSAEAISRMARELPRPPAVDYLTSDFIHPGDLLIMQCGMTDLMEEPILEDISHESGPPLLKTLPLERFEVLRVFRPEGESAMDDTTMTRVRAGAWLMVRGSPMIQK
ncbi:MAG TPA: glycosyltransferase family 39 protein [Candidatus Kapabacteria bacterium]|nr:glycosyltransferase family 39 protein [Candidatus Kapabacteria bacterium]